MTWQRSVFETMGTMVSLVFDAPDEGVVASVRDVFVQFDHRFSLYRPESELSRIVSGELRLEDATDTLLAVYADALDWRARTAANFTPHRPDGVIDLSGIVKAAAMAAAGDSLAESGVRDWCLNVGGDVLVAGRDRADKPWTVGIVEPTDRATLLTSAAVTAPRHACATSGSAERGDHIWSTSASMPFQQVTVLANDIVTADVLATAVVSGGASALDSLCLAFDIDVLTVDRDGALRVTPGFSRLVAA